MVRVGASVCVHVGASVCVRVGASVCVCAWCVCGCACVRLNERSKVNFGIFYVTGCKTFIGLRYLLFFALERASPNHHNFQTLNSRNRIIEL